MNARALSIILAGILVLTAVATTSSGNENTTVVIWHAIGPNELVAFKDLIDQFMIEHPDISIKLTQKAELENAIKVSVPAKEGPDLFVWAHDWVGKMVEAGFLEPIDEYITQDFLDEFSEIGKGAVEYKGSYYGVPFAAETVALVYNKDMVSEPPETFAEMQKIMKKYYDEKSGKYGLVTPMDAYFLSAWAHQFGGLFFNDKMKKPGLNDPKTLKGFEFFFEKIYPYIPPSNNYNVQVSVFHDKKAPMMINGPWSISDAEKAGIRVGIVPLPPLIEDDKTYCPRPYGGVKMIYMTSNIKNKDAAWTFLEWFSTNLEVGITLGLENGYISTLKSVMNDPEIKNDPVLYGFGRAMDNAIPMPKSPEMGAVWDPITAAILNIMSGKLNIQEALEKAQKDVLAT